MKFMKLKPIYSYHAPLKLNAQPSCASRDRVIIIKLPPAPSITRKLERFLGIEHEQDRTMFPGRRNTKTVISTVTLAFCLEAILRPH